MTSDVPKVLFYLNNSRARDLLFLTDDMAPMSQLKMLKLLPVPLQYSL